MSKKNARTVKKVTEIIPGNDAGRYIKNIALWGICILLFLAPFFRGLFFPEDQQKALFFAVIVFWVTLLWKWINNYQKPYTYLPDYFVLAIPLVYFIAAFNSANSGFAVDELVKATLYFLVYWVVISIVSGEEETVKIFKVICLTGVLVSLAGLATATDMVNIRDGFQLGRIASTLQYPNALASFMIILPFFSFYLWTRSTVSPVERGLKGKDISKIILHSRNQFIYLLCSYISLLAFIGSKSNGGYLVFMLMLALYFILLPGNYRISAVFFYITATGVPAAFCSLMFLRNSITKMYVQAWLWVLAGTVVVIVFQLIYVYFTEKNLQAFIKRKHYFVIGFVVVVISALIFFNQKLAGIDLLQQFRFDRVIYSAEDRLYFYKDALKMIFERPMLGWGGGGWQGAYRAYQGYYYNSSLVHGYYIQSLVEVGIIGLAAILSIWGAFFFSTYSLLKRFKDNHLQRLLVLTIFITAFTLGVHAIIDFNLSLSALALVLYTLWAMMRVLYVKEIVLKQNTGRLPLTNNLNIFVAGSIGCLALALIAGSFIVASSSSKGALSYLRAKDLSGAILLMERAAKYNPFNSDYNAGLSTLYALQGKSEHAVKQAEDALNKSKYTDARYSALANLYISSNRSNEAIAMAEKAIEVSPFNVTAYENMSRIYLTIGYNLVVKGQDAEAKAMLKKVVEINERIDAKLANLGSLEKRLWVLPPFLDKSSYTLVYSGAALCLLGEYENSYLLLSYASSDEKVRAEALIWLAVVFNRQGKHNEANDLLERVKRMVPDAENKYQHIYRLLKDDVTKELN